MRTVLGLFRKYIKNFSNLQRRVDEYQNDSNCHLI